MTSDGSHTIYIPELDEQYHSVNGAVTESEYVYINAGFRFSSSENPKVFEVGFGTGLNCLLTALQAEKDQRNTVYHSIERFPLAKDVIQKLDYGSLISDEARILFEKIHDCQWNETVQLSEYFSLKKIFADLKTRDFERDEKFDIIYFDAFGPDKQPDLWTPQIFSKISMITNDGGILVTYSAKGEVRRQLMSCGFVMERLQGPPGKKQMLKGIKKEAKN